MDDVRSFMIVTVTVSDMFGAWTDKLIYSDNRFQPKKVVEAGQF